MFESANRPSAPKWLWLLIFAVIGIALVFALIWILRVTRMPLRSHRGPLPLLSTSQSELAARLAAQVNVLSVTIGERSADKPESLQAVTEYLAAELRRVGYEVSEHSYSSNGQKVTNLEAILLGDDAASGAVIVGAHYDCVPGTVGADDNATGVAAILELARMLHDSKLRKTIRFVLFVNEEPPFFQTDTMGSLVYARQLKRENAAVSAMLSLEMLGYYSEASGSQKYPAALGWLYPSQGNFIGFVGKADSPELVRRAIRSFRETTSFPSEGVAAPVEWPGVGWSDHWSFWQAGYPAIMITDTAIFRNPYYHTPRDTADKLDFAKMARVVEGIRRVVEDLSSEP
jgi:Zn-dependent M28 family amino/carboxypeptidase